MQRKMIILYIVLLLSSTYSLHLYAKSTTIEILNYVQKSLRTFELPKDLSDEQNFTKIISTLKECNTDKIIPPESDDFAPLQNKTRHAAMQINQFAMKLRTEQAYIPLTIDLSEAYFQFFAEIQSQMRKAYDSFHWQGSIQKCDSIRAKQDRHQPCQNEPYGHCDDIIFLLG